MKAEELSDDEKMSLKRCLVPILIWRPVIITTQLEEEE